MSNQIGVVGCVGSRDGLGDSENPGDGLGDNENPPFDLEGELRTLEVDLDAAEVEEARRVSIREKLVRRRAERKQEKRRHEEEDELRRARIRSTLQARREAREYAPAMPVSPDVGEATSRPVPPGVGGAPLSEMSQIVNKTEEEDKREGLLTEPFEIICHWFRFACLLSSRHARKGGGNAISSGEVAEPAAREEIGEGEAVEGEGQ